jgi:hypothetical protein
LIYIKAGRGKGINHGNTGACAKPKGRHRPPFLFARFQKGAGFLRHAGNR